MGCEAQESDMHIHKAVVSSRKWPSISNYRASVYTQSPKVEMIDALFKHVAGNEDHGMFIELLSDFYASSGKIKPEHIIIFRFDVAGAGACLKRYTDPSFFKTESISNGRNSEAQREKKSQRLKFCFVISATSSK